MSAESTMQHCPKCGTPIPAEATQGLCPKCLLAAASAPTETGHTQARPPGPSLEAVQAAFPHLEILELIGAGGMGTVYKARQPKLERLVALKILPQSLAKDPAFAERFAREARLLARLNHPNIVTIFDFGHCGDFYFLIMEFVDGVNLRQAMQAGRFTPQQALMIVPKICEALQFAHDEGVLHRDIKPENILLDAKGRIKIADFGIAKLLGDKIQDLGLTASGVVVGTPNYMAPEQLERPRDVDQRADIYSLGVVFYEMLTGELPIGRFAPPSQKVATDPRVDEVVLRALEKEREKRYRTATEVKTSVEALQTQPWADFEHTTPSTGPAAEKTKVVVPPASPARWSVKAISGVVLVGLSVIPIALLVASLFILVQDSQGSIGMVGFLALLVPAVLAALAGTILGGMAISDVRQSGGRLRGLVFALVAGLAWPLLFIDWVLVLVATVIARALPGPAPDLVVLVLMGGAALVGLVLDGLVMVSLWRWAKGLPVRPARSHEPTPQHRVFLTVLLVVAATTVLLWVTWRAMAAWRGHGGHSALERVKEGDLVPAISLVGRRVQAQYPFKIEKEPTSSNVTMGARVDPESSSDCAGLDPLI